MRTSLTALAALITISGCSGGTATSPTSGSAVADLDVKSQPPAAAPGTATPGEPAAGRHRPPSR